jgi:histidine triad (HIT) family protein
VRPAHEPSGYVCPFCAIVATGRNSVLTAGDIVARNPGALAFVSPRWWPNNRGHVIVVPAGHHENLYGLPATAGHAVHDLVGDVAVAIRSTYDCDGVSVRQNNEPAGGQSVWHYHVHVIPRYAGDDLYRSQLLPGVADGAARRQFADKVRGYLAPR